MKKVKEVAAENNITVRTLHHYDEIGLVCPKRISGIRYYSVEDINALKKILLFKELGFSLKEIATLLKQKIPANFLKEK